VAALVQIGESKTELFAALGDALKDKNASVRYAAALALFGLGPEVKSAVPVLSDGLKDKDVRVRRAAAMALGEIGPEAESAVSALAGALKDKDHDVRYAATQALGRIGAKAGKAVPALAGVLPDNEDDREDRKDRKDRKDHRHPAHPMPALTGALQDNEASIRRAAALALGKIGREAKAAVPALIKALEDEDRKVRRSAAEALGQIGCYSALHRHMDDPLMHALSAASKDRDRDVRNAAADALWASGNRWHHGTYMRVYMMNENDVGALIEVIKGGRRGEEDVGARCHAAGILGRMGAAAKEAAPALVAALKDKDEDIRFAVAVALVRIGTRQSEAFTFLRTALKDKDEVVRRHAAQVLGQIGAAAKPAVPALSDALKDEEGSVRIPVAAALVRIGERQAEAFAVLREALKDQEEPYNRRDAAETLKGLSAAAKPAVPDLIGALNDKDHQVRWAAADALGTIGPAAVPALSDALQRKEDAVRIAAAVALGQIGPKAKGAVPALGAALKDRDRYVRSEAAKALTKILAPAQEFPWLRDSRGPFALSPNRKLLACGADVWRLADGTRLRRLSEKVDATSVAFSPDGRLLAGGTKDGRIEVWELSTGKEVLAFRAGDVTVVSLTFAANGLRIDCGLEDSTELVWDVIGKTLEPGARQELTAKDLEKLWADLAHVDARIAFKAGCTLIAAPQQAVPFLQKNVDPVIPVTPQRLAQLIAELGNIRYKTREAASRELEKLGREAEPALQRALKDDLENEVRERINALLPKIHAQLLPAREARLLRSLLILETIGTPEAAQALKTLGQRDFPPEFAAEIRDTLTRVGQCEALLKMKN
jgi:HEAT repeat protein